MVFVRWYAVQYRFQKGTAKAVIKSEPAIQVTSLWHAVKFTAPQQARATRSSRLGTFYKMDIEGKTNF